MEKQYLDYEALEHFKGKLHEGSNIFPGTLDEWEALTEEEKANYDFIASPDEESITDSYSTTETKTGATWIDGKPIYRKVIQTTSPSSTDVNDIGNIPTNLENLVNLSGFLILLGYTHPINQYINSSQYIGCWLRNGTGKIAMQISNSNLASKNVTLILEYTKTTD